MATTTACLEVSTVISAHLHEKSNVISQYLQRETVAAEQPWTATRCHRQLRPLLTHLMALRREKARAALKREKESDMMPERNTGKHPASSGDNLPNPKRVRYTYSTKGRRRQSHPSMAVNHGSRHCEEVQSLQRTKIVPLLQQAKRSLCPGEVVVATPVFNRARKHRQACSLPSSPLLQSIPEGAASLHGKDSKKSRCKHKGSSYSYRGYYQESVRLVAGSATKLSSRPCMDADWIALFKSIPPDSHQTYEAIFRATESLLRTTMMCSQEFPHNSKSLLAMCLRKVPQYVVACEETVREKAEEEGEAQVHSTSVSLGIYSELESLGNEEDGWKHLRTVVRQHGIGILQAACAEGLLRQAFIHLLVRLCTHMKAYSEAEGLLTALFGTYTSSMPKGRKLYGLPGDASSDLIESNGPLTSLKVLLKYSKDTGRTSVPLQLITDLLVREHLPSAWLSTPSFASLWHQTICLLSSRSSPVCDEDILINFVAVAMTRLALSSPGNDNVITDLGKDCQDKDSTAASSTHQSSSYHTLVSILGNIIAVSILQQEAALEGGNCEDIHQPAIVKRLSVIVQQSFSEIFRSIKRHKGQHRLETARYSSSRQFLLLLAVRLFKQDSAASKGVLFDESLFCRFIDELTSVRKDQVYDATIALITATAENCGRAIGSTFSGEPASRSYLLTLCAQAADVICRPLNYCSTSDLTNRLLAGAAFLLASRSNDLRDLAFAESIGTVSARTILRQALPSLTPRVHNAPKTAIFEGYHWEEGISEWVVSTPRSTVHSQSAQSRNSKQGRASQLIVYIDDLSSRPLPAGDDDDESSQGQHKDRKRPISFTTTLPSFQTSKYDPALEMSPLASQSQRISAPSHGTNSYDSGSKPEKLRRPRPKQSLLNLVSDDEPEEKHNKTARPKSSKFKPQRMPLSHLAGSVNSLRRSVVSGRVQQHKILPADSYDELGL